MPLHNSRDGQNRKFFSGHTNESLRITPLRDIQVPDSPLLHFYIQAGFARISVLLTFEFSSVRIRNLKSET